jgi:hypothetical protein
MIVGGMSVFVKQPLPIFMRAVDEKFVSNTLSVVQQFKSN